MSHDPVPLRPSSLAPILRPLRAFLAAESSGALLLMLSTIAALVWANSPWGGVYHDFWHADFSLSFAGHALSMSLAHWINDGLMAVFFLLVGLEIKRELLIGELASVRRAALPLAAAVGGMVVPAGIYATLNSGGAGAPGWGIPMATDIAFAVGVLALVGRDVPASVKVFLLAIAIVDDLGAVLVIAIFYTGQISGGALALAGLLCAALALLNLLRVHSPLPYLLLGLVLWLAMLHSGLHATVAGVLLAFAIPATRQIEELPYVQYVRKMLGHFEREATSVPDRITPEQSYALKAMEEASQAVQTPLARVEHALLTPVSLIIVPLFALANAGVDLRGSGFSLASSSVAWGVALGLLFGKPLGVLAASWLALKTGAATPPEGSTHRQIVGVSILCGIGFTMSLFVANLAFGGNEHELAAAKVGTLAASLACGLLGAVILRTAKRDAPRVPHPTPS
jgi:NhaA family Na+:H+ antiporter